jgi:hypothetical protein
MGSIMVDFIKSSLFTLKAQKGLSLHFNGFRKMVPNQYLWMKNMLGY